MTRRIKNFEKIISHEAHGDKRQRNTEKNNTAGRYPILFYF